MRLSDAWLEQSRSDFDAAMSLFQHDKQEWYCHILAKLQQCVEKAVKGLAALLSERGGVTITPGRSHKVTPYLSALRRLPRGVNNRTIQNQINGVLGQEIRSSISMLDALAPAWPAPGQRFVRNTEYPFEGVGGWTCPSALDAFSKHEVDEFRSTAWRVVHAVSRLRSAIRRMP